MIKESKSGEIRSLNTEDINDIRYNKYLSAVGTAYRVLDEIPFKKLMKENGINNINEDLITQICEVRQILPNDDNKKMICSRIEMFLNPYYPNNDDIHNISDGYDLFNGMQLSNESRFIYAYLFTAKFNHMNMTDEEQINFYKNYINEAKNLSFEDVLKKFDVDLTNPLGLADNLIEDFNQSVESKNVDHRL